MKTYMMYMCVLMTFLSLSCAKEHNELVLKRDTDQLSFAYQESRKSFTVRATGDWHIDLGDADWLTVSKQTGRGDGNGTETVELQASRNLGEARQAAIRIVSGGKEAEISIEQQEGKVVFGSPYFSNALVPGQPVVDVYIVIPYTKGGLSKGVPVGTTISGSGAAGIHIDPIEVEMVSEAGEILIPLLGTPTALGALLVEIELIGQRVLFSTEIKESSNNDPVGTVYLKQDFNKLVLGGDHVSKKAGLQLIEAWATIDGKRVLPDNATFAISGTANTDGTGDYFATMHNSYVSLRGLEGWTGSRVYERPGYLKINTAASSDGFIATPALSAIKGTVDIKVSFSTARWSENTTSDINAKISVNVLGAGESEQSGKLIDLSPNWETKEILISNATAETKIEFRGIDASNGRFLLDNIEIQKIVK